MWTNYMVKWVGVEKLVSRAHFYIVRIDFFPVSSTRVLVSVWVCLSLSESLCLSLCEARVCPGEGMIELTPISYAALVGKWNTNLLSTMSWQSKINCSSEFGKLMFRAGGSFHQPLPPRGGGGGERHARTDHKQTPGRLCIWHSCDHLWSTLVL